MAKRDKGPLTDNDFQFGVDGVCKGAAWTPKGMFVQGSPGNVTFKLLCNHPEMAEGKKSWTQPIAYYDFLRFLGRLRYTVNMQDKGELKPFEMKLHYFKDGKMNLSGVSALIGRSANGVVYYSFRSKQIPKVGFMLTGANGKMTEHDSDGNALEAALESDNYAMAIIEHYLARYKAWTDDAIEKSDYQGGGNSGGGYTKKNNGNNQASDAGDSEPEFDEDLPF